MFSRIGEILVQKKHITWQQLEEALDEQRRTRKMLGEILVQKTWISKFVLYQLLAEQNKMRFVDLNRTFINPKAVNMIPLEIAEKYGLIPIEIRTGTLIIAISNALNNWPKAEIIGITGVENVQTVLCLPEDIEKAISVEYRRHRLLVPQAA